MARAIYEITLKQKYFPALDVADALELRANGDFKNSPSDEEFEVSVVVKEEDTMKLFFFAKTIMDTEKFNSKEIAASVGAMAKELGYFTNHAEIADCVITWVERFDHMTLAELEEWIIE